MTVGHSELLLRSNKGRGDHTRIDIMFKPVRALKLPSRLDGIQIREADGPELGEIFAEIGRELVEGATCFIVTSGSFAGYVVADGAWSNEDRGDYSDPSPLMPE